MAKPTDEVITLPTMDSLLVRKQADDFVEQSISLQQLFAQQPEKGLIVYFYPKDNTSGHEIVLTLIKSLLTKKN